MDFTVQNLAELGKVASHRAYHGEDLTDLLPPRLREVLVVAVELGTRLVTLDEGFVLVVANWHASGDFSRQTQDRLGEIVAHAVARARYLGVTHFDDTFDEQVCAKFIRSPVSSTLTTPSASTMHLRRSALRACFHTLRRMDHFSGDPTLDIVLPPRSQLVARMATDDEMVLLRMNAVASRESRQPMTLVLAEAMATSSECPRVRIEDLDDLENPTAVALPGGKGVRPRTNPLTPWGIRMTRAWVKARLDAGAAPSDPLVYFGDKPEGASSQVSVCRALDSIFRRAGLGKERDLKPRSIGFWAGRQAFEAATEYRLEAAANAMGIKSLDKAARRIDHSWESL